jgi:hypothetical protein
LVWCSKDTKGPLMGRPLMVRRKDGSVK